MPAITGAGRVGIRADNDEFVIKNFGVWRVSAGS